MPFGRLLIAAFAPQGCNLETLAGMASRRWSIKHVFGAARQKVELDSCEARNAAGCTICTMTRP